MQRAMRHTVFAGLVIGAVTVLGVSRGQAGDWGLRMIGDLGGAPKSGAKTFFDASKHSFQYSSRGLELGVAWKEWDAGVFLYTINKGFMERGYSESTCGVWPDGHEVCLPPGVPVRDGVRIQAVGLRLLGVKAGRYVTVYRPTSWLRFGVPLHAGLATYTGKATQETWTRGIEHTAAGDTYYQRCSQASAPGQCVPEKIKGEKVFAHGGPPYVIVSLGIGAKVRTASWAEFEVAVKAENPRLPVLSWGMTFRKQNK